MRITSNLRNCFLFLVLLALIYAGLEVFSKITFSPQTIDMIIYGVLILIGICLLPFAIKFFRTFLMNRADAIEKVVPDKSGLGIHVFARNILPNTSQFVMSGTVYVLHYFVRLRDGKAFFSELTKFSDELVAGKAGYKDEKNIFGGKELKKSLEKLSQKTGIDLKFGDYRAPYHYEIIFHKKPLNPEKIHEFVKHDKYSVVFHSFGEKFFKISCIADKKILWEYAENVHLKARNENCLILDHSLLFVNAFENSFDRGFMVYHIDLHTGKVVWKVKI